MYVVELTFELPNGQAPDREAVSDVVNGLLGSLRMNGQLSGVGWPIVLSPRGGRVIAMASDRNALDPAHHDLDVRIAIDKALDLGLGYPQVAILGEEIDSDSVCTCASPASYILLTSYLSIESPLRCGDCDHPIPLYRIPHFSEGGYYPILEWQSAYQACDALLMETSSLEGEAILELSGAESSLSLHGRDVCGQITKLTGKPVYYFLYRDVGQNREQEKDRRCPSCDGPWLLDKPWHESFDFRCDVCRLVSKMAWNVS